jgi:hypothetical protein
MNQMKDVLQPKMVEYLTVKLVNSDLVIAYRGIDFEIHVNSEDGLSVLQILADRDPLSGQTIVVWADEPVFEAIVNLLLDMCLLTGEQEYYIPQVTNKDDESSEADQQYIKHLEDVIVGVTEELNDLKALAHDLNFRLTAIRMGYAGIPLWVARLFPGKKEVFETIKQMHENTKNRIDLGEV